MAITQAIECRQPDQYWASVRRCIDREFPERACLGDGSRLPAPDAGVQEGQQSDLARASKPVWNPV
jgi:hypothetical protein